MSKHFDSIEFKTNKREFVTHTGFIGKKRISVISTGIGTDNIDIVFNELDALVNIDLENRTIKEKKTSLNIIRVGTSGTLQNDIAIDSILLSTFGLGLDGLMNFYAHENSAIEKEILAKINQEVALPISACLASGSQKLIDLYKNEEVQYGITLTATGFYGPQGRKLRLQPVMENFIDNLAAVHLGENRITNLEMETAGIYGLGKLLGHHCLSVNGILANRQTMEFSKRPKEIVEKAIKLSLEKICEL